MNHTANEWWSWDLNPGSTVWIPKGWSEKGGGLLHLGLYQPKELLNLENFPTLCMMASSWVAGIIGARTSRSSLPVLVCVKSFQLLSWPCLGLPSPILCFWMHWCFLLAREMWFAQSKTSLWKTLTQYTDFNTLDGVVESTQTPPVWQMWTLSPSGFKGFLASCGFIIYILVKLQVLMLLLPCQHGISTIPSRSCGYSVGRASVWGLCGIQPAHLGRCGSLSRLSLLSWRWEMPHLCVLGSRKLFFKMWCPV